MDSNYGAQYATLYHSHWWWRAREEFLLRVLDKWVGPSREGRVLDFGCGNGLFFPALARYGEPIGIETDTRLLDPHSPWYDRIRTTQLVTAPEEHRRYRLIVALDVLEHIADPIPIVEELSRRLCRGGLLVVTVPAFRELWTTHDDLNHHMHRYRLSEIESLIRSAGLSVMVSQYFFVWLAAIKWLIVRKEKLFPTIPRPPKVPWIPINRMLLTGARLEQKLLKLWPSPPAGSSIMVVARAPL